MTDTAIPTRQPALLTGPYDWDPAKTPLAEFQARLEDALGLVESQGATMLLVHGDRLEFGALAYLSGFVPKLGPALALFPLVGPASLLFSGGPGMAASARRLTWIETVRALGPPARDFAPLAGERVALWGEAALSQALHEALAASIGPAGTLMRVDAQLDGLRRAKSPSEQALLARAAAILAAAADRLGSDLRAGEALGHAMLAAERCAYEAGAQDVRILAARRPGGPPLPVDDRAADVAADLPLPLHVAVRYGLYWAQGWLTAAVEPLRSGAGQVLRTLLADLKPDHTVPTIAGASITGIGLSLAEAPFGSDQPLVEGDALCIRLADEDGPGRRMLHSAMLIVRPSGPDILWSTLPLEE